MERDISVVEGVGVQKGDCVCLVGGGGKTSLLYSLVRGLRASSVAAFGATTTKMFSPEPSSSAALPPFDPQSVTRFSDANKGYGFIPLVSPTLIELKNEILGCDHSFIVLAKDMLPVHNKQKLCGIDEAWAESLLAMKEIDVLVIEGDGAGCKPLKAPKMGEPVVPQCTSVFVMVVGLSCLNKPLTTANAFRVECIQAVTQVAEGELISFAMIKQLLTSPNGLRKHCPPSSRTVVVLNQCDSVALEAAATAFGQELVREGVCQRAVVCALQDEHPIKAALTVHAI